MTDTLAVLALDAADYRLACQWDCENMLLEQSSELETYSYSKEWPFTPEVWTTIATGVHAREHQVEEVVKGWENPILDFTSKFTQVLPNDLRNQLGQPFRNRGHQQSHSSIDIPHAFDDGTLFSWPGVVESKNFEAAWEWIERVDDGSLSNTEFDMKIYAAAGEEMAWLTAAAQSSNPIVGVHSHILDAAGHIYAKRPNQLRRVYDWVDRQVEILSDNVERLVVLSDHGMQTSACNDDNPGIHSFDSFISSQGIDSALPESVFDCAEWLERHTVNNHGSSKRTEVDVPSDHLRDLGYIE